MLAELRDYFFSCAPWIIFLPLVLLFAQRNSQNLRLIWYYLVLSLVTQFISILFWFLKINNLPLVHVYTCLEFLIVYSYFLRHLPRYRNRLFFKFVPGLFLIFAVADTLWLESIFEFNTISRSIEALIFIVLALLWFARNLTEDEVSPKEENGNPGYFISGLFIYFSGSVVLFSCANAINSLAKPIAMNIWSFHTLLLVTLYVLFAKGILTVRRT